MIRDEDIYDYDTFKAKYLQQPITMLTDENLRRLEMHCERTISFGAGRTREEHLIVLELIRLYKNAEEKKQKIVEEIIKYMNALKIENKIEESDNKVKGTMKVQTNDTVILMLSNILKIIQEDNK